MELPEHDAEVHVTIDLESHSAPASGKVTSTHKDAGLSSKVDNISQRHSTLERLPCEYNEVRRSVELMRKAGTVDKAKSGSCPSRTTNQAVLMLLQMKVVHHPPFRSQRLRFMMTFKWLLAYDRLAKQLLDATLEHLSEETLSRLCGVAADGPYQTTGFRKYLRETLDND